MHGDGRAVADWKTTGGMGGKVADPPGAAPKRQVQQAKSKVPGAKRVKIRSGPYRVPNMGKKSFPSGHAGMVCRIWLDILASDLVLTLASFKRARYTTLSGYDALWGGRRPMLADSAFNHLNETRMRKC
jgi:hypothetical protein